MTERSPPWWRSFVGKRRKAARELAAVLEQQDRHPELQQAAERPSATTPQPPADSPKQPPEPTRPASTSLHSNETYDDSTLEPSFSEASSRRNLRVSRSGRFKEKRRTRASLPLEEETTAAEGKEEPR